MPKFNFVLLYVEDPPSSAAFYADLLGTPPVETSPTFAMLPLGEEVMLGPWSRPPRRACGERPGRRRSRFTVADADETGEPMPTGKAWPGRSPSRRPQCISATPSWRSIPTGHRRACSPGGSVREQR